MKHPRAKNFVYSMPLNSSDRKFVIPHRRNNGNRKDRAAPGAFGIFLLLLLPLASCGEDRGIARGVTVAGTGEVSAAPDMARFTLTISEVRKTTAEAQEQANQKISQILKLLEDQDIAPEDIRTLSLSLSPQYEWTDRGRKLVGQKAQQTLEAELKTVQNSFSRLPTLLDQLAEIDGINLGNIEFDLADTEELEARARRLAFDRATAKAQQYADLSNRRLGKVVAIRESSSPETFPVTLRTMEADSAPGAISPGEAKVVIHVTITYELN